MRRASSAPNCGCKTDACHHQGTPFNRVEEYTILGRISPGIGPVRPLDVEEVQTLLEWDTKMDVGATIPWTQLTDSPIEFPPAAHTHTASEIEDFAEAVGSLAIGENAVNNTMLVDVASATLKGRVSPGTGDPEDLTGTQATTLLNTFSTSLKGLVPPPGSSNGLFLRDDGTWDAPPKQLESIIIAASDASTPITTGAIKEVFRMPYPFVVTEVRASLGTAQVSGPIVTVDISENGTSILSTPLTIDNNEKTSTTATPAIVSDPNLADDAEMTVGITQVGDGTAVRLKIIIIGYQP